MNQRCFSEKVYIFFKKHHKYSQGAPPPTNDRHWVPPHRSAEQPETVLVTKRPFKKKKEIFEGLPKGHIVTEHPRYKTRTGAMV